MREKLFSISRNLESLVRLGGSSRVQEQLFDGRNWEEVKMSFHRSIELLAISHIEEDRDGLRWLVLRLGRRVKMEWEKCTEYKNNFTIFGVFALSTTLLLFLNSFHACNRLFHSLVLLQGNLYGFFH